MKYSKRQKLQRTWELNRADSKDIANADKRLRYVEGRLEKPNEHVAGGIVDLQLKKGSKIKVIIRVKKSKC